MDKYDLSNNIHCYPNTNVLKNKLGITDGKLLEEAEREITSISIDNICKLSTPTYFMNFMIGQAKFVVWIFQKATHDFATFSRL
jgi:cell filamentation protein